jgi:heme-degrading monooxygenase HmoA
MTDTTFRVFLTMEIHPGLQDEFERTWRSVGQAITSHPANRGQWLMRSNDDPTIYHILSDWTDEPRFREFERSSAHVTHREKLHPYRARGTMTTMNVVCRLDPVAAEAVR